MSRCSEYVVSCGSPVIDSERKRLLCCKCGGIVAAIGKWGNVEQSDLLECLDCHTPHGFMHPKDYPWMQTDDH